MLAGAGNGTDLSDKDPLRQWVGTMYYVTMQVSSTSIMPVSCHCKQLQLQLQLHQGPLSSDARSLPLLLPLEHSFAEIVLSDSGPSSAASFSMVKHVMPDNPARR